MLYKNTESGKTERLKQIYLDINNFIAQLNNIQTVDDTLGINLLKSCNALNICINGSYAPQQKLFDAESKRLEDAYMKFWKRIDRKEVKP